MDPGRERTPVATGVRTINTPSQGKDHRTLLAEDVEVIVYEATVSELLDALTPPSWVRYGGARCPLCQRTSAYALDDGTRWACMGSTEPNRSDPFARRIRSTCGLGTIWQLRRLVLEDPNALDWLLANFDDVTYELIDQGTG